MTDIEVANDQMFPCDKCEAVYAAPQALGIHKRTKHGIVGRTRPTHKAKTGKSSNQLVPCPECGTKYQSKYLWYGHLPKAHGITTTNGQYSRSKELVPVVPMSRNNFSPEFTRAEDMIVLIARDGSRWIAERFPN